MPITSCSRGRLIVQFSLTPCMRNDPLVPLMCGQAARQAGFEHRRFCDIDKHRNEEGDRCHGRTALVRESTLVLPKLEAGTRRCP